MAKWFPITTPRLLLREFSASDEDDVHEYAADPLVSQYDSWGPNTRNDTHRVISDHIAEQKHWPRSSIQLAAELRNRQKVIGTVRFWLVDESGQTAEFGYTLNRAFWGNGYATEAARELLRHALHAVDVRRVIATCDVRNARSWRVMEKLGMRREQHFVRDRFQKGEWRDSYLYAIEKSAAGHWPLTG